MRNELDVFRNNPQDLWDAFSSPRRFNRFVENLFDPYANRSDWRTNSEARTPRVALRETQDHYVAVCELPGVPKDQLDLEIQGQNLHIRGERTSHIDTEWESGKRTECFEHCISLPEGTDPDQLEAHYEDGILYVAMPKLSTGRARKIEIQASGKGMLERLKGTVSKAVRGKTSDPASKSPERAA